jgi:hypothetical protein
MERAREARQVMLGGEGGGVGPSGARQRDRLEERRVLGLSGRRMREQERVERRGGIVAVPVAKQLNRLRIRRSALVRSG